MAQIVWGTPSTRSHEFGVSHGLIFLEGVPIPWNGLTSVSRSHDEKDRMRSFIDGVPFTNLSEGGHPSLTAQALSFPDEALPLVGMKKVAEGIYVGNQPHLRFDFSYQTRVDEENYKIHFCWNATATRGALDHSTYEDDPSVNEIEIDITMTPLPNPFGNDRNITTLSLSTVEVPPGDISAIEDQLYGTVSTDPEFPTIMDVVFAAL